MTFRVSMVVGPDKRTVVTNFVGCVDAEDAKVKAKAIYDVVKFKKVEEAAKDGKRKPS
jgi:hypothetical protein